MEESGKTTPDVLPPCSSIPEDHAVSTVVSDLVASPVKTVVKGASSGTDHYAAIETGT